MAMRDILKLRTLKDSKSGKRNKIYEKAHRFMRSELVTPDLTDEDVMEIAVGFSTLKVKCLTGGDISIRSLVDEWVIRDEGRFYTLYHKGISMYKGRIKESFHVQDIFSDLNYIFASVVNHDDFVLGKNTLDPFELAESISA